MTRHSIEVDTIEEVARFLSIFLCQTQDEWQSYVDEADIAITAHRKELHAQGYSEQPQSNAWKAAAFDELGDAVSPSLTQGIHPDARDEDALDYVLAKHKSRIGSERGS